MNRQWRYDQLVASDRFTLSHVFKRAGWRTVDYVPANDREWPQVVLRLRQGLRPAQPRVCRAEVRLRPMPDQYVLLALQRLELARPGRRGPLFAEIDMVSSHAPWTRTPELIDWGDVGNGSVFNTIPVDEGPRPRSGATGTGSVRPTGGRSSTPERTGLLRAALRGRGSRLVLVGDHQPSTIVTGLHPDLSHDVPISVVAHDPAVLDQIAVGVEDGLRPSAQAAVWPMDAFRDRFLSAFGTSPAPG